jgi:hypothetical protein
LRLSFNQSQADIVVVFRQGEGDSRHEHPQLLSTSTTYWYAIALSKVWRCQNIRVIRPELASSHLHWRRLMRQDGGKIWKLTVVASTTVRHEWKRPATLKMSAIWRLPSLYTSIFLSRQHPNSTRKMQASATHFAIEQPHLKEMSLFDSVRTSHFHTFAYCQAIYVVPSQSRNQHRLSHPLVLWMVVKT